MAGLRLDGAGQAKMITLEDALILHHRLHGLVETYAISIKNNKPAGGILQNIKRQFPLLAAKLKGQFGMISDLVTAVTMQATRGSSEQMRVRQMREGIGSIKQQLEIAVTQTIARHEAKDEKQAAKDEALAAKDGKQPAKG